MTVTLHVEANNVVELAHKVAAELGLILPRAVEPTTQTSEVALNAGAPVADPAVPNKRGRKPKNPELTQPAVVENTGSAPAEQASAAEGAGQAAVTDATATASVTAPPSADAFRAKLQDVAAFGDNAYKEVVRFLEEAGFKSVKAVPPDAYAPLMARCNEWLASQQKAA